MKKCGLGRNVNIFIVVFMLIVSSIPFNVVAASAVKYQVSIKRPYAELILKFSFSPKYTVRNNKRGKVINFDRALNISDMHNINKRLSPWVEDISISYDAVLVQLKPGATMHLVEKGNHLHLNFVIGDAANSSTELENSKRRLAMERVDALYLLASGRLKSARLRFKELIAQYPNDVQLLQDLARVEESLGNWGESLALYERVEVLRPESLPVKLATKNLLHTHGNRLSAGLLYNKVGSQSTQVIGRLYGRKLLEGSDAWAVDYEIRDADEESNVRRVNGDLKPFTGQRHSLAVEFATFHDYAQHKLTLFATEKNSGLGWEYQRVNDYGRIGMNLQWRAPWFETAEALVGYGYKESLAFNYANTFAKKFTLSSELSVNSYGLEGVNDAANSLRLKLAARLIKLADYPDFSLGYGLDLEDVTDREQRTDVFANTYTPLPLDSRELHVFDLGWTRYVTGKYFVEAHLGYEYDRKRDSNAPYGRLHLSYRPDSDFELNFHLQTGLSSYRGGEDDLFGFGANVVWFY